MEACPCYAVLNWQRAQVLLDLQHLEAAQGFSLQDLRLLYGQPLAWLPCVVAKGCSWCVDASTQEALMSGVSLCRSALTTTARYDNNVLHQARCPVLPLCQTLCIFLDVQHMPYRLSCQGQKALGCASS
jgi:hypothetical protein